MQSAFTYLWQLACEQRDVKTNPRPVFWFVDEAHELVCNYTPEFLATARSARVASVLISQNKPNYLAAMGGEAGRHRVDAFLGNMGTKIFHANGDPETNQWASDMISEEVQTRTNWHGSIESGQGRGGGGRIGGPQGHALGIHDPQKRRAAERLHHRGHRLPDRRKLRGQ